MKSSRTSPEAQDAVLQEQILSAYGSASTRKDALHTLAFETYSEAKQQPVVIYLDRRFKSIVPHMRQVEKIRAEMRTRRDPSRLESFFSKRVDLITVGDGEEDGGDGIFV